MFPLSRSYKSHLYHLSGECEGLDQESTKYICKHRLKIHSISTHANDFYDLTDSHIPITLFKINELAIMVLEYCADSECAKAIPFESRCEWYKRLKQFYLNTPDLQQVNTAINCYSGALNPEVFCRETALQIQKFVQTAQLMSKEELSNLSDLNILPLIAKIKHVMDVDLCALFELVRIPIGINIDSSIDVSDKASFIRKWLMDSENQKILKTFTEIHVRGRTATPFTIPPEICFFSNLKVFSAGNSNIQRIPIQFFSLSHLETIFLNYNFLSELPSQIGNLTKLKRLELNNNCLEQLPNEILNLPLLERLTLGHNPWIHLPKEMSFMKYNDCEAQYRGRIDFNGYDCGFIIDLFDEHLKILDGTSEKKCNIS